MKPPERTIMDATRETITIQITGTFTVDRAAWNDRTVDDQAEEVHRAVHDVETWKWKEVGPASSDAT